MFQSSHKILLSPVFLSGLFLLLLNDFFLKPQFGNFLTGKLSDFAGLFIFPLFFAAFFPKRKLEIYIFTGVFFIFWKSPFSQSLINFCNSFEIFRLNRTVDLTDLFALSVLPASYAFFVYKSNQKLEISVPFFIKRFAAIGVIFVSVFAFTATSYEQDRSVFIDNKYELNMNINEFENRVKNTKSFDVISFEKKNRCLSCKSISQSQNRSKRI